MKAVWYLIPALLIVTEANASSTIDTNSPYAYGANIGWVNAFADGTNGAVIGQFYCTGYIFSANVGWISLGTSNGIAPFATAAVLFACKTFRRAHTNWKSMFGSPTPIPSAPLGIR